MSVSKKKKDSSLSGPTSVMSPNQKPNLSSQNTLYVGCLNVKICYNFFFKSSNTEQITDGSDAGTCVVPRTGEFPIIFIVTSDRLWILKRLQLHRTDSAS